MHFHADPVRKTLQVRIGHSLDLSRFLRRLHDEPLDALRWPGVGEAPRREITVRMGYGFAAVRYGPKRLNAIPGNSSAIKG